MEKNIKKYDNFIGGVFAECKERIKVYNPATEELISTIPSSGEEDISRALESATHAKQNWAGLPAIERAKHLRVIANKIREKVLFWLVSLVRNRVKH
ncbi:aldehyde dehydrogenase family protein [Vibrio algarum]|uniref:Aldehyde dehydrogenase family protein n=1 Tax=Vibrio algarum TaxID=3020714 RepID=A0ABT4YW30_9VIBR|nr:aldehyde dehydrogenase family protein [Vibrio sp. KJ40-1]MDB1125203.1 aldehyde dehydrogenase family protein [Vibrio sp. KJ40-1]